VRDVERVYIKAFHLRPEACHRTTFIKQSYKEQYAHKLMLINKENEDYTNKYAESQEAQLVPQHCSLHSSTSQAKK
jgi:hypothetical protein